MMITTMIMMMTTMNTKMTTACKGHVKKIHQACLQSKPYSLSNGDTGT